MLLVAPIKSPRNVLLATIRLYAFILIVWGEVAALGVLSTGRATSSAHDALTNALITETVLLAIEPLVAFVRAGAGAVPSRFERYVNLCLKGLMILIGLVLAFLGILQIARSL